MTIIAVNTSVHERTEAALWSQFFAGHSNPALREGCRYLVEVFNLDLPAGITEETGLNTKLDSEQVAEARGWIAFLENHSNIEFQELAGWIPQWFQQID